MCEISEPIAEKLLGATILILYLFLFQLFLFMLYITPFAKYDVTDEERMFRLDARDEYGDEDEEDKKKNKFEEADNGLYTGIDPDGFEETSKEKLIDQEANKANQIMEEEIIVGNGDEEELETGNGDEERQSEAPEAQAPRYGVNMSYSSESGLLTENNEDQQLDRDEDQQQLDRDEDQQ
jgi:hypothetical protein